MLLSIKNWLSEPLTRGLDLDDPALTHLRRSVLNQKAFLRAIYAEWYGMLSRSIPGGPGAVLELGSGAGFSRELLPQGFTSEVFWLPGVSLVLDGCALPFADHSFKAILRTDVLHHIPTVRAFFDDAARCLVPGGVVAMIEPWYTPWSGFIYRHFHHEPFHPEAAAWEFASSGPLSGANGALPWIVFQRDQMAFRQAYPSLTVETLRPLMPLSYLLSGGISMRSLVPAWTYRFWRAVESPWSRACAMFGFILLRQTWQRRNP
jgi:SAM-dependent methyltransferase